eukprot:30721-Pelagococcus_subviridis.AAC.2
MLVCDGVRRWRRDGGGGKAKGGGDGDGASEVRAVFVVDFLRGNPRSGAHKRALAAAKAKHAGEMGKARASAAAQDVFETHLRRNRHYDDKYAAAGDAAGDGARDAETPRRSYVVTPAPETRASPLPSRALAVVVAVAVVAVVWFPLLADVPVALLASRRRRPLAVSRVSPRAAAIAVPVAVPVSVPVAVPVSVSVSVSVPVSVAAAAAAAAAPRPPDDDDAPSLSTPRRRPAAAAAAAPRLRRLRPLPRAALRPSIAAAARVAATPHAPPRVGTIPRDVPGFAARPARPHVLVRALVRTIPREVPLLAAHVARSRVHRARGTRDCRAASRARSGWGSPSRGGPEDRTCGT